MAVLPMDIEILPPSDDRIFKTLMTHPDAKKVLINVVSSIIERPVIETYIRNVELPVMDTEEKLERFDVNCVIENGDQIDVEMQASRIEEPDGDHRNLLNKLIYYLTDLHSSQKSKGVKYNEMVRTYQATFCNYTIFPYWPVFYSKFSMRRSNGEQLSDQINMVIIELSKLENSLKKPIHALTQLETWSMFFRYAPDSKHRGFINEIINEKEEVALAADVLMEISKDERERARYRSSRMAETDLISNLLTVEARGEARGEVRGEARGIARIALNLKNEGMPVEYIARMTNLSITEIENLDQKVNQKLLNSINTTTTTTS